MPDSMTLIEKLQSAGQHPAIVKLAARRERLLETVRQGPVPMEALVERVLTPEADTDVQTAALPGEFELAIAHEIGEALDALLKAQHTQAKDQGGAGV